MHPYRSLVVLDAPAPRPERTGASLRLALGVLATVSFVQLVTAYEHAGPLAVQTLIGACCLAGSLVGLARARLRP